MLDAVLEIAEFISADACEIRSNLVNSNPMFHTLQNTYKYKIAGDLFTCESLVTKN